MTTTPIYETRVEKLAITVFETNDQLGHAAAHDAAAAIRQAVADRGVANVILATGNSQLTFLTALRQDSAIPWDHVNVFHMDEYIGLPPGHSASFPRFLKRHLLDYVTPRQFFPVPGDAPDRETACREYEALLHAHPADLCALGYGENGHLAFNDPPFADFDDPLWVKVVKLDDMSRRQQVSEGHFTSLDEVPTHAMTLTIPALLAAKRVLAIVPEARKATAVERALLGPITEDCPGSVLRQIAYAHLFLDRDSAKDYLSRTR